MRQRPKPADRFRPGGGWSLVCAAGIVVLTACTKAPEEVCEGGFDDSTCTLAQDEVFMCDECGISWTCHGYTDPALSRWSETIIPCECVCADGGILNTSDEGGTCYRQVGEHNDEDSGPYRETCDDPRWDE